MKSSRPGISPKSHRSPALMIASSSPGLSTARHVNSTGLSLIPVRINHSSIWRANMDKHALTCASMRPSQPPAGVRARWSLKLPASSVQSFGITAILVRTRRMRNGRWIALGRAATASVAVHPASPRSCIHSGVRALGRRRARGSVAFISDRGLSAGWPGCVDARGLAYRRPLWRLRADAGPTSDMEPDDVPPPRAQFPCHGVSDALRRTRVHYVLPYRPGCDSQTQTLPGKDGEERSITIVRC